MFSLKKRKSLLYYIDGVNVSRKNLLQVLRDGNKLINKKKGIKTTEKVLKKQVDEDMKFLKKYGKKYNDGAKLHFVTDNDRFDIKAVKQKRKRNFRSKFKN
jgi:hypothetical protein